MPSSGLRSWLRRADLKRRRPQWAGWNVVGFPTGRFQVVLAPALTPGVGFRRKRPDESWLAWLPHWVPITTSCRMSSRRRSGRNGVGERDRPRRALGWSGLPPRCYPCHPQPGDPECVRSSADWAERLGPNARRGDEGVAAPTATRSGAIHRALLNSGTDPGMKTRLFAR